MAQSLSNILLHIIVSTKDRQPLISDIIRSDFYGYIVGIFKSQDYPVIEIGGSSDHVHVLCVFCRTSSVAKLIENFKTSSSKWIKSKGPQFGSFYWQNGYGVFSVSLSNKDRVVTYINGQEEHHRKLSFVEEYREFLKRHNVQFDEKYVWE